MLKLIYLVYLLLTECLQKQTSKCTRTVNSHSVSKFLSRNDSFSENNQNEKLRFTYNLYYPSTL